MNSPFVSVIMPNYNGEKYIDQAVESVLSQTYTNWELLIIDDGSKDNSPGKINRWTMADSRIHALFHPGEINKGVSATRNLGMSHANGKYIALLDCDDVWVSNKLENQIGILEADPELVLTYSKAIVIDDAGIPLSESKKIFDFPQSAGNGNIGKSRVFLEMISDIIWMPCCTVVFPRSVIDKIGGFEENMTYQSEDFIYCILLSHLGPVYFSDTYMAKYRIHDTSYTTNNPWKISIFETYQLVYKHLPRHRPELKNLFKRKLIEFFPLYFFDKSRREFVSNNAKSFFDGVEFQVVLMKTLLRAIFNGSVRIKNRAVNLVKRFVKEFVQN